MELQEMNLTLQEVEEGIRRRTGTENLIGCFCVKDGKPFFNDIRGGEGDVAFGPVAGGPGRLPDRLRPRPRRAGRDEPRPRDPRGAPSRPARPRPADRPRPRRTRGEIPRHERARLPRGIR